MNKSNKVGVVVLNYINYQYTIECVKSFLKQKNVDLEIVIVDNGSKNESYHIINNCFKEFKNIKVIENRVNEGYAKGNNIGISYLRKSNINFVVLANSDTIIIDNSTINKLVSMYKPNIAVISPNIKNEDGSNGLYVAYKKNFLKLRLIKACIQSILLWKLKLSNVALKKEKKSLQSKTTHEIGVTGSFFVLTPAFFKYYGGLYDKTFLYFEENALIECLRKKKLNSLKCNDDETLVLHKGAASSSEVLKTSNTKKKLMAKSAVKVLGFIVFR